MRMGCDCEVNYLHRVELIFLLPGYRKCVIRRELELARCGLFDGLQMMMGARNEGAASQPRGRERGYWIMRGRRVDGEDDARYVR